MNSFLEEKKKEFDFVDDSRERLELLIDYGKQLNDFPKEQKTEDNRVPGCVSGVYIVVEEKEGKVFFKGSSESLIVKGYVYLLTHALNGLTKKEIVEAKEDIEEFIKETKISNSLIASRANAFGNIYTFMKEKAKCI